MAKMSRAECKKYNEGFRAGYSEGYKSGYYDGNIFNRLTDAINTIAKNVSKALENIPPEQLEAIIQEQRRINAENENNEV